MSGTPAAARLTGPPRPRPACRTPLRLAGLVVEAEDVPPDPISNSAVKASSAHGTVPQGTGESVTARPAKCSQPRIPSPRSGSAPRPSGPAPAAGWSSPVARQAHNLKVTGSNPVPATTSPDTQKPRPARHRGSCRDRASSRNSNPIMRAPRARAPQGRRGGRHGSILESGSLRKARGGSPDVFGRGLQSPRRRKPHGRTLA